MSNGMNKKGVSLVEVLVATAIFAIVIAGIVGTLAISVEISKKINYEYAATNLAKKRLERARTVIKTEGFVSLSGLAEESVRINASGDTDDDGEFERTTVITENYGSPANPRLTKVEARIWYYYRGNKTTVPVSITTLFTNVF